MTDATNAAAELPQLTLTPNLDGSITTPQVKATEIATIDSESIPAKIDDSILIEAKTLRAGKNLAFLEVEIKNKDTGDLLVKGSHTKYLLQVK